METNVMNQGVSKINALVPYVKEQVPQRIIEQLADQFSEPFSFECTIDVIDDIKLFLDVEIENRFPSAFYLGPNTKTSLFDSEGNSVEFDFDPFAVEMWLDGKTKELNGEWDATQETEMYLRNIV